MTTYIVTASTTSEIVLSAGDTLDVIAGVSVVSSAALLDDGSIEIEFAYRNGDEAVLKAKCETSSTAC